MKPDLQPWRLTLDTNPEDCNASCIMCEEHSPHSTYIEELFQRTGHRRRRMPREWLPQILDQACELGIREVIPSTMGEPLIYPHFDYLLELVAQRGLRLNLTTNGSFPRRTVEDWAQRLVPITTDVKFSWNGATKPTYEKVMIGLDFDRSLDNLRRFVAVRDALAGAGGNYCRVTLQLTFMTHNMHELADIIALAARCNVDRLKGHHLWAHWQEVQELGFKHSPESRRTWNRLVAEARATADRCRRPDGQPVLLEGIYELPENPTDDRPDIPDHYECPFLGREIWVAPDGRINPCCAPDELRQQLGFFGRVPETTLRQALESPEYLDLLNHYRQRPLCQTCNMRKP